MHSAANNIVVDNSRGKRGPFAVRVLTSPASPLQVFGGMYGTMLEVLGSTSVVIVLVIFFLVRREDLRDRFIHLIGKGRVTLTTQTIEDAGARVTYILHAVEMADWPFADNGRESRA